MKICTLGNTNLGYSWYVLGIRDACKYLGHSLSEIDYRSNPPGLIARKLEEIKPDVLFTHLTFHNIYPVGDILQVYRDIRKKFGTKVIHVLADARHEPRYNRSLEGAIDHAFVSQTHNLKKFQSYWKVPTHYWQYYCLSYEKMAKPSPDLMAMFSPDRPIYTGSISHPDRIAYLNGLQRIMNIKIIRSNNFIP